MAGSAAAVAAQLMVARPRMHPDVAVQAHVAPPPLPWGDRTTNEPTRSDLRCYECTGCAFYFDARPGQNDECPVCGDWVQRPLPDPPRPAGAGQARATRPDEVSVPQPHSRVEYDPQDAQVAAASRTLMLSGEAPPGADGQHVGDVELGNAGARTTWACDHCALRFEQLDIALEHEMTCSQNPAVQQPATTAKADMNGSVKSKRRPAVCNGQAWRRSRIEVAYRMYRCRAMLACAGAAGLGSAILQNELIFVNFQPNDPWLLALKFANTVCTLFCVPNLCQYYLLDELQTRIRIHLRALYPLDTGVSMKDVWDRPLFWLEMFLLVPHIPPYVTFEVGLTNWQNFVLYRAETLGCIWNFWRIYLVLDVLAMRYLECHENAKVLLIATFTNTRMNFAHAVKRVLNADYAALIILVSWLFSAVVFGYWFKALESTACLFKSLILAKERSPADGNVFTKVNDPFVSNAIWAMYITSTTTGYGDILATTHLGRFVSILCSVSGLFWVAMLTASLSKWLQWTPDELSGMLVMERERAKRAFRDHAARTIQHWFFLGHGYKDRSHLSKFKWAIDRQKYATRAAMELDQCLAADLKLDQLLTRAGMLDQQAHALGTEVPKLFRVRHPENKPTAQATCHETLPSIPDAQSEETSDSIDDLSSHCGPEVAKDSKDEDGHLSADGERDCVQDGETGAELEHRPPGAKGIKRKSSFLPDLSTEIKEMTGSVVGGLKVRISMARPHADSTESLVLDEIRANEEPPQDGVRLGAKSDLQGSQTSWTVENERQSRVVTNLTRGKRAASFRKLTRSKSESWRYVGRSVFRFARNAQVMPVEMYRTFGAKGSIWALNPFRVTKARELCDSMSAFAGIVSSIFIVLQCELVLRGANPSTATMNIVKGLNSACTVTLLGILYRTQMLKVLQERHQTCASRGGHLDVSVSFSEVLRRREAWALLLFIGPHIPPGVTFEVWNNDMLNIVVYHVEIVMCLSILPRLYLLWAPFAQWYVSDLPCQANVGALAGIRIDSRFVLKRLMNSAYCAPWLTVVWVALLFIFGYLYRSLETTSCNLPYSSHRKCADRAAKIWKFGDTEVEKINDFWLTNAVWFIFVTMTTVGYGDYVPSTIGGRLISVIAILVGICIVAIATGALYNQIAFNNEEQYCMALLQRENAKDQMRLVAAKLIMGWWLGVKGKHLSPKRMNLLNRESLRREFLSLNFALAADMDDLMNFDAKLDLVIRKVKNMEAELDKITSSVNRKLQESQDVRRGMILGGSSSRFFKSEQTVITLRKSAKMLQ